MKTNRVNGKKKFLIIAIVCALLISAGAAYLYSLKDGRLSTEPQAKVPTPPTPAEVESRQQTEASEKQSYIESKGSPVATASPAPAPTSPDTITLSTKNTSTSEVTVFTSLKGYSGGECKLDIVNGSKVYTKTVSIIYQPDASTCAGYSVPYDALGGGEWHITLTVTPTGGSPITKEFVEQK